MTTGVDGREKMAFTGWQLQAYRQRAGITQAQLGEAVQMTRSAIAKIEA